MNTGSSLIRIRLSISQIMIIILIITVCLAPLTAALKSGNGMFIFAAVALDVIAIPLAASLVLSVLMKRKFDQPWLYGTIWLTPSLFVGGFLMVLIPVLLYLNPFAS